MTVWAACSATTVGAGASANGSVLNTSTADLYYDQTVSVNVNGSLNWGAGPYWVWYPKYTGLFSPGINPVYILQLLYSFLVLLHSI